MRPFVFVNVAMSADGKLSTRERRQVRISGKEDFLRVDRIKAESDGVMVGIGTVLADDPSLTVKSPALQKRRTENGIGAHPIRVVVDSRCRIPPDAAILHKGEGERIIAVSRNAPHERVTEIRKLATVVVTGDGRVDLGDLLGQLYEHGVRRLMVEGGGSLIWSLLSQGYVDEIQTFIGGVIIGGADAPTPADGEGFIRDIDFIKLRLLECTPMEDGVLIRWSVMRPEGEQE